jgi:hypothetical protein
VLLVLMVLVAVLLLVVVRGGFPSVRKLVI